MFIEALGASKDLSLLEQIVGCTRTLNELLDDTVMMHVDEPDGSFARSIRDVSLSFHQLVRLMRQCLSAMYDITDQSLDLSHLQVVMPSAA